MIITVQDILNRSPCNRPVELGYCKEDWSGTLHDIVSAGHVSVRDRIWAACQFMGKRKSVTFAVWCANRALRLANIDARIAGRSYVDIKQSAYAAY